jgi:hypothetical protein
MTIRMLQAWNGLHQQKIVTTLSGSDEAALVAAGIATYDLDGPADNLRMAQLATDADGNVVGIDGVDVDFRSMSASSGYFCHLYAPQQSATDKKAFDLSGAGSDGIFGANLPVASAWATAGFVSTLNPGAGATDSVIRMPALIWDFLGKESLLIFWKGVVTPEGADEVVMGSTAAATPSGLRIRCKTTGVMDFVISSGGTQYYSSGSAAVCFEAGKIHSFALAIDGVTARYNVYVDGVIDRRNWQFNSGVAVDCLSVNTWNIGAGSVSPGGTSGMAVATQALAMLRGRAGLGLPGNIDEIVADLHRAPGRMVDGGAW